MLRRVKNKLALFFSLISFIFTISSLAVRIAFLVIHLKLRVRSNSKKLAAQLAPIIGEKAAKEIAKIYKDRIEETFFKGVGRFDLSAVFSYKFRAPRKTQRQQ